MSVIYATSYQGTLLEADIAKFAHVPSQTFYNNTHGEDIKGPKANHKCSLHFWSDHGIAGRGILLDWRSYADKKGLPF